MTDLITEDVELERARAEVYRFFAALFLNQPTPEMLDGIFSNKGLSALDALFPRHRAVTRLRDVAGRFHGGTWKADDFILDYEAMFRVPGDAYIHPYESVYRDENSSKGKAERAMVYRTWALEVARLYQTEGLGPRDDFTELPDHLGVELEFMAFLCHKMAEALEKGDQKDAAAYRARQRAFLREHILLWCRGCLTRIEECANTPLYRCLAGLLRSFLENEELRGSNPGMTYSSLRASDRPNIISFDAPGEP